MLPRPGLGRRRTACWADFGSGRVPAGGSNAAAAMRFPRIPLNSTPALHTSGRLRGISNMRHSLPRDWMWSEACEMLSRAERMHREFFRPGRSIARSPHWEPPVDILETEREVLVLVALPGVDADRAEAFIEGGELVIGGTRTLPRELATATIQDRKSV